MSPKLAGSAAAILILALGACGGDDDEPQALGDNLRIVGTEMAFDPP